MKIPALDISTMAQAEAQMTLKQLNILRTKLGVHSDLQKPRTLPRQHGPATAGQTLLAAAVNERIQELRPQFAGAAEPAQMREVTPQAPIPREMMDKAQQMQQRFVAMSDEEMGRYVRQGMNLLRRYLNESDHPSAPLLDLASRALAGAVGQLPVGGSPAARRAIRDAHEDFDHHLMLAYNGELTLIKANAEAWMEEQRSQLADLAEKAARAAEVKSEELDAERAMLLEEVAAARRQLDEERDLLTHAADQAQAEASAARRDAEQARRELAEAKERHRENGQKNRDLAAEEVRRAKASEKEARSLAQQQAAQLEAQARELESLRAQLAARDSAAPAQEAHTFPPAPEAKTQHQEEELMPVTNLDTPLEALSYRAWLALAGHDAEASDKTRTVTCGTATAATLAAWRAECPTPEQQQGMVFRAFRQRRGSVAA